MFKISKFNNIDELKLYIKKDKNFNKFYPEFEKSVSESKKVIRYKYSNSVSKVKFVYIRRICGKYFLICQIKQHLKS